jgi:hypothetical protein
MIDYWIWILAPFGILCLLIIILWIIKKIFPGTKFFKFTENFFEEIIEALTNF